METVYIGIGSNLGDRKANIAKALECLRDTPLTVVERVSSIYETDPVGGPPQGKFLNGVVKIKTRLSPRVLLSRLKDIENKMGRRPTEKCGPRPIDLDILTYGELEVSEGDLIIPHPRMHMREFVLKGLTELQTS